MKLSENLKKKISKITRKPRYASGIILDLTYGLTVASLIYVVMIKKDLKEWRKK